MRFSSAKAARPCLSSLQDLEDQLEIGTQARPQIFARRIEKPSMLYAHVIGAHERVRASGDIELPLDEVGLRAQLSEAYANGLRSAAIVFMHAYAYPAHEVLARDIARDIGFTQISVSHEVSSLIKIVPRGDTTVADAYLSPVASALCRPRLGIAFGERA